MAVEQYVFLDESRLPSADKVNALAQKLGYGFVVAQPVDLTTHRGYLPVNFDGEDTGFEAYFMPANQVDDLPPEAIQKWSHYIATITGGDAIEAMSATIYLRVVAELAGGAYWHPDDGLKEPPEVSAYLDETIRSFKGMVEKNAARAARRQARKPEPKPTSPQPSKKGFFSKLFGRK